jgi:hypothetical protein
MLVICVAFLDDFLHRFHHGSNRLFKARSLVRWTIHPSFPSCLQALKLVSLDGVLTSELPIFESQLNSQIGRLSAIFRFKSLLHSQFFGAPRGPSLNDAKNASDNRGYGRTWEGNQSYENSNLSCGHLGNLIKWLWHRHAWVLAVILWGSLPVVIVFSYSLGWCIGWVALKYCPNDSDQATASARR